MHVHLPKPLHGWRAFAGEVGIIVLGVLIALGAEQFVESLHWRHEVHETRKAVDAELSHDLAALQFRINQGDCAGHRLDELDRWSKAVGNGGPRRLAKPIDTPVYFAIRTAVWDSTNGEVASRMPLEAKLNYAKVYGAMKTLQQLLDQENNNWTTISSYEENRDLDRHELHEFRAALKDLKYSNDFMPAFQTRTREFADKLGLKPEQDLEGTMRQRAAEGNRQLCKPLLSAERTLSPAGAVAKSGP
jgi:hypothetical protein